MISEDEYLERIVASIHALTSEDAEVSWNEKINGRQFDVVVRFTVGTLRYLVVVEVKNRGRPASANDVEAFVTKARDQNVNKAVFVTAAGFQKGAAEIAKRHGVELFTVEFAENEIELFGNESAITLSNGVATIGVPNAEFSIGEPMLIAQIDSAILVYSDGRRIGLPTERTQMEYYAARTLFKNGRTIQDLIAESIPRLPALGERITFSVEMERLQHIAPPDEHFFPAGKVTRIECEAEGTLMRPLRGSAFIEPTSFRNPVIYKNWLTGEMSRFSLDQLPLGVKHAVRGSFYFLMHPLRYYYCDKIEGDTVHWVLVEALQGGHLYRARYTQDVQYSVHYMPVSKAAVLRRLRARLSELEALERRNG